MQKTIEKETVWSPTQVQFLYRHRNGRYYVRTFAGGKEKWTSLKTKLLTVARNRMKDHVDAAERQRTTGNTSEAVGRLTFGEAIMTYREQLQEVAIRPNTKAFSRSRFETRAPILGERGGAKCAAHNVKNGRRMAWPL